MLPQVISLSPSVFPSHGLQASLDCNLSEGLPTSAMGCKKVVWRFGAAMNLTLACLLAHCHCGLYTWYDRTCYGQSSVFYKSRSGFLHLCSHGARHQGWRKKDQTRSSVLALSVCWGHVLSLHVSHGHTVLPGSGEHFPRETSENVLHGGLELPPTILITWWYSQAP